MKPSKVYTIILWLLIIEFSSGLVWGIHRALASIFTKEELLITSFAQIGLVVSVFGLTKAVTNLGFGALSDRTGRKPVILLGLALTGLGGHVIASAPTYLQMLIGTALIGLGGGSTFVGIMVAMTETLPSRKGLAMGLFELAAYGGSSAGTALAGTMAALTGLRYPFYLIVGLALASVAAAFFTVSETKKSPRHRRTETSDEKRRHRQALKDILPLCLAGFSSKIMDSLVWSFLPLYFLGIGMNVAQTAVAASAFTLSWALFQPFSGHASDKLGRKNLVIVGLATTGITVVLLTATRNYPLLVALDLLLGLEAALFYTPIVAMVSDIAPPGLEGTLIGSYRFFRDIGYFAGPILLGLIADTYGLANTFPATAVSLFVATAVVLVLSRESLPKAITDSTQKE